jgi:hypothetical protein
MATALIEAKQVMTGAVSELLAKTGGTERRVGELRGGGLTSPPRSRSEGGGAVRAEESMGRDEGGRSKILYT